MATVPVYAYTTGGVGEFRPGSGLPIVTSAGVLFTDQSVLNVVAARAAASGVRLAYADHGGSVDPSLQPTVVYLDPSTGQIDPAFIPGGGGGGAVSSVAGRTGDVVLVHGDITDFNASSDARIANAAGTSLATLTAGKIPSAQIPALALTNVQVAASQAAQLALTTQEGDVVTRTDTLSTYMRNAGVTGTMADFTLLNTPTDAVASAAILTTSRNIDGQAFNGSAAITVIAPGTHAATGKSTPIDADELPIVDTAASNVLKKLTWANLKATLLAYFQTKFTPAQVVESGGVFGNRPITAAGVPVTYVSKTGVVPTGGGTEAGGTFAVNTVDLLIMAT